MSDSPFQDLSDSSGPETGPGTSNQLGGPETSNQPGPAGPTQVQARHLALIIAVAAVMAIVILVLPPSVGHTWKNYVYPIILVALVGSTLTRRFARWR